MQGDHPDAPGLTWRPLAVELVPVWHELVEAIAVADGDAERFGPDDLVDELEPGWIDLATDSRIGLDAAGRAVAFGLVQVRPGDRGQLRVQCWGGVHPRDRRRGIGRPLLRWQERRARSLAARRRVEIAAEPLPGEQPGRHVPGRATVVVPDRVSGSPELLAAEGFAATRWFSTMQRDLSRLLPEVALPDGVGLQPFSAELDQAVRLAHNDAFTDHWGFQPWTAESWRQWETGYRHFRPEWSFVVLAGDEVAGYTLGAGYPAEWEAIGYTEGWTTKLGVRRPWRGRGIAKALLATQLRAFAEAGMRFAGLDVDSANPTGAVGLYTGLGYRVRQRSAQWSKEI